MSITKNISLIIAGAIMFSCTDQEKFKNIGIHENTRWEFAPNMYHSKAYEPLTQITDENQGVFISSDDDGVGEYYNSNPHNPHQMNMRVPAEGTIKRTKNGFMPYHIPKDSLSYAAKVLVNPLENSPKNLADGELLYAKFCAHCHGAEGKGDGPVNKPFKGVANLAEGQLKTISMGHVFHVISNGKGRMLSHASQLDQEERWKVALYVKNKLQVSQ
ncbi:MAG: cytochrome c [Cytophagales bacterium]|nr:MAG: cytochrome c [Cytophagales bacterium]